MNQNKRYVGLKAVNLKAAAFGLWCCLGAATANATGGLAGLYAEQPPAGSVFVRLLNAGAPVQVAWANGKPTTLPLAGNLATAYRVIDPSKRPELLVNDKAVGIDKLTMTASYPKSGS